VLEFGYGSAGVVSGLPAETVLQPAVGFLFFKEEIYLETEENRNFFILCPPDYGNPNLVRNSVFFL